MAQLRLGVCSAGTLLAAVSLLFATAAANASTFNQVGANVVLNGSGTIDLSGLTTVGCGNGNICSTAAFLAAAGGDIIVGSPSGTNDDGYTGFTGPTSFGSGALESPGSGSGDIVGIDNSSFSPARLIVPQGYGSGSAWSDTSTYDNTTIDGPFGMGLTPGTYTWTWDRGADSFTLQIGPVVTPLPAALPLLATGIGGLGLLGWRRKRRARA